MARTRLSAAKFIRNNKRQVAVIIAAISLSFMAMYVVKFLIGSTGESFKPIMLEMPKHFGYVDLTAETLGLHKEDYETGEELTAAYYDKLNEIIDRLKEHRGIDDAYYTQLLSSNYNGVIGMIGYDFPLVEPDKVEGFLEHMDATLTDGRMPKGDGEILVDEVVMKNNKFNIGDTFFEKLYGKTFEIVGTVKSDRMVCVGTPNGYTNSGWGIVILCDEETSDFKSLFDELGITLTDNDNVADRKRFEKFYREQVEEVSDSAMTAGVVIITCFLSLAVLVGYISFLRNRMEEYCLYLSIGYSKREVYGMLMREVLLLFGGSVLIGMFAAVVLMVIFARALLDPMGLGYTYWYPEYLATIFAALIMIIGALQIPILVSINSVKTIDRIEE